MAGRVVELRAGAREPQVGDRLAWDGMGWVPAVNIARPHGVTHVHTDTIVRVVMGPWRSPDFVTGVSGWQIDADGSAEFNDVVVRGTIYAEAGEIGGWTISATEIKSGSAIVLDSSVPKMEIGAGGYIRSSNYVSGFDGFHIDEDFAEFGNVQVRGSLHCAVFVKDLISAHAGTLLVTKSAGKLDADATVPVGLVQGDPCVDITIEDPPTGGALFDVDDIVCVKEEYASGVHETWMKISGSAGGTNQYATTYQSGDLNVTYHRGTVVVDYGASGDGGILQTADMTNAPYLAIFTHAGAPWTTITQHLRLGNLKGTGDFSSDAYGIFIGDYSGNKWMSYDPTNSLRIRGDAIIEGTVAATMFTNDIGATLFSKADGLLLLGPNCEITDAKWQSLRGQAAVITGALHQEAGRWMGTRALVVEKAATNYELNPRMYDGDSDGVADGWAIIENVTGSPTTTVGAHLRTERGWLQRIQWTGVAESDKYIILQDYTAVGSFAAGDAATVSLDYKGSISGVTMFVRMSARDAAGAHLGYSSQTTLTPTSTLQRATCTYATLPANTSYLRIRVQITDIDQSDTVDVYLGAFNVEKTAVATSFVAGNLGHEYTWSGTEEDSTSARVLTIIDLDDYTDLVEENNTFSARVVAQMPYDADATWLVMNSYLFDIEGTATGNRCYLTYNSDQDEFRVYINGDIRLESAAQTFKAGDWLDLVVTLDFTNDEYKLYIDGELVDTDTTSLTYLQSVSHNWRIGGVCSGSDANTGGFAFAEYAVFDKVLTPAEVAAMHALQRPLVDAGALDRPGIYILDGQFKMASSLTGNRVLLEAEGIRMVGTGIVDDVRRILFQDESSGLRTMGWVGAGWGGGGSDPCVTWLVATRDSGDPWPATAQVDVAAVDTVVGTDVRIVINSNKTVEVYGEEIFKTEKLLRPGTGTSDPTAKLEDGCLFYRTDTDKLRLRANGAWVDLN